MTSALKPHAHVFVCNAVNVILFVSIIVLACWLQLADSVTKFHDSVCTLFQSVGYLSSHEIVYHFISKSKVCSVAYLGACE